MGQFSKWNRSPCTRGVWLWVGGVKWDESERIGLDRWVSDSEKALKNKAFYYNITEFYFLFMDSCVFCEKLTIPSQKSSGIWFFGRKTNTIRPMVNHLVFCPILFFDHWCVLPVRYFLKVCFYSVLISLGFFSIMG